MSTFETFKRKAAEARARAQSYADRVELLTSDGVEEYAPKCKSMFSNCRLAAKQAYMSEKRAFEEAVRVIIHEVSEKLKYPLR
jgi:hypothetical protein